MADPLVNSPVPDVGSYQQADVLATNAYNNALARINQQRQSTLQQYGYGGSIDPTTGTLSGLHVDAANPYGNFQQMLQGAALQSEQDQFANQERGLRGGLANQAITADKNAFGGQSAQLGSQLADALSGLQDQQDQAAYTRDSALWQAEQTAAENAIANQAFDTPSYAGVTTPGYGSTGTLPTPSAPKVRNQPVLGSGSGTLVKPHLPSRPQTVKTRSGQMLRGNPRAYRVIQQRVARQQAAKSRRRPRD